MKRFNLGLLAFLGVAFVAGGDRVFPGRIGAASEQARTGVVRFVKGIFPSETQFENPNNRTEEALKELER